MNKALSRHPALFSKGHIEMRNRRVASESQAQKTQGDRMRFSFEKGRRLHRIKGDTRDIDAKA